MRSIQDLVLSQDTELTAVLERLNQTGAGVVFLVNTDGKLSGILTDGDIRRALVQGVKLDVLAKAIMNTRYVAADIDTPRERLLAILGDKVRTIPLLDVEGTPVDFASIRRIRQLPIMEPSLKGNELQYVAECVSTGWISSQGKFVVEFEKNFAELLGAASAISTSSGTTALHLALVSLGIGPGDEVIVPDLTFAASVNSVIHAGARPILADIDPVDWCMGVPQLERVVTPGTRAIMPVHLYGQPSRMLEIIEWAARRKIKVVEDCAESLGSKIGQEHLGRFGDASAYSFFGNKMITTGEGGMVVFRDPTKASLARTLRDHGMNKEKRYWHEQVGYNYRLTNLQAAIGVAQLERWNVIFRRKQDIAKWYCKHFSSVPGVRLPIERPGEVHSHWLFTVMLDPEIFGARDLVIRRLAEMGVDTRPVFYPLHFMPIYAGYRSAKEDYQGSTIVSATGLSLPSSANLEEEEVFRVAQALKKCRRA